MPEAEIKQHKAFDQYADKLIHVIEDKYKKRDGVDLLASDVLDIAIQVLRSRLSE